MKIKIRFFGQLAEISGKPDWEIDPIADTDSLTKKILSDFPKLKEYKFVISVDRKIIKENTKLEPGNEVAFLPPFAGG
jgi:molybdopterin synthase sulfur carrier subunit